MFVAGMMIVAGIINLAIAVVFVVVDGDGDDSVLSFVRDGLLLGTAVTVDLLLIGGLFVYG